MILRNNAHPRGIDMGAVEHPAVKFIPARLFAPLPSGMRSWRDTTGGWLRSSRPPREPRRCVSCEVPLTDSRSVRCLACYRAAVAVQRAATPPRECASCGEPFEAKRVDKQYCSKACVLRAHRRRTHG